MCTACRTSKSRRRPPAPGPPPSHNACHLAFGKCQTSKQSKACVQKRTSPRVADSREAERISGKQVSVRGISVCSWFN